MLQQNETSMKMYYIKIKKKSDTYKSILKNKKKCSEDRYVFKNVHTYETQELLKIASLIIRHPTATDLALCFALVIGCCGDVS